MLNDVRKLKLCWYCGKRNADDQYKAEYDMYKLLKRKETFAVVAIAVKTNYLSKSIDIPRCKYCANSHFKMGALSLVIYIIGCSIFIWSYIISDTTNTTDQKILGIVLVLVFASPLLVAIWWLIKTMLGVRSEKDFPEVAKLLNDGWKSGDKPYRKGGDYDINDND